MTRRQSDKGDKIKVAFWARSQKIHPRSGFDRLSSACARNTCQRNHHVWSTSCIYCSYKPFVRIQPPLGVRRMTNGPFAFLVIVRLTFTLLDMAGTETLINGPRSRHPYILLVQLSSLSILTTTLQSTSVPRFGRISLKFSSRPITFSSRPNHTLLAI